MKMILSYIKNFSCSILLLLIISSFVISCNNNNEQYNILVISGGKNIERESFLNIFEEMNNIYFKEAVQPEANNLYDSPEFDDYDALIFYDFVQEISEVQKQNFLDLLNEGKGIIFLHHSLVSYQNWDEFENIIGGRYYQSTNKEDSLKFTQSTYKHDVEIPVQIVNKNHPITNGLNDFIIHDEIYGKYKILPNVKPILTTTHPESENVIGWTNNYGKSRIVYIQLGHDHNSFDDRNYRQLIKQSIDWVVND